MIKNVFSATVKILRTGNGCEFFNSQMTKLLQSLGILQQSSCVYSPQQNGVVERKHRHILDRVRALRFQDNLPLKFRGECVLTSVYLINKLPSTILKGKTPFGILFHTSPSLDHLKVFGCLAFAKEDKKKWINLLSELFHLSLLVMLLFRRGTSCFLCTLRSL